MLSTKISVKFDSDVVLSGEIVWIVEGALYVVDFYGKKMLGTIEEAGRSSIYNEFPTDSYIFNVREQDVVDEFPTALKGIEFDFEYAGGLYEVEMR